MNRFASVLLSLCLAASGGYAFATDSMLMGKDTMDKKSMHKKSMKKHSTKKDTMKKDSMETKGTMGKDPMPMDKDKGM